MKVLISLSYYHPYISGLTLYAQHLAEGLVKEDVTVSVLASQHDKKLPLHGIVNNVHVYRVPITLQIGKGPLMFGFLSALIKRVKEVDVVNCHLPQFESSLTAFVAKCFKKKVVLTYHTDLAPEKSFIGKFIRSILFLSQICAGFLADKIVTQTKDYANHSAYLSFFRKKVVPIYPPMPEPSVNIESKKRLDKKLPTNVYRIGMVGRMAREKGIEYLLEAIPLLKKKLQKDFIILLAGPKNPFGEDVYTKKISHTLEQYKDNVAHIGVIIDEDMGAFYASLDVLVLPSLNKTEAFGMVQIEAMSCGTPVVVSNLPGVRIPVQKTGMGEITKIGDSEDIAEKITSVLHDKSFYIKEKKIIEKEFGLEKVLSDYKKILQ